MNSTQRFTAAASVYDAHRPDYPVAAVDALGPLATVADIGAGTGILTRHLLERGATVFAVEPNQAMREVAEAKFRDHPRFTSLAGTAEATGLPDHSVDLVVAAQAFHWFDPPKARAEFTRILTPGGRVGLLWNDRRSETPLLRDYEAMLTRFCEDYQEVGHRLVRSEDLEPFFTHFETHVFENHQSLDWEGLVGRVMSCSYVPREDHPKHEPMMARLREIFGEHQHSGKVRFEYDTRLFLGACS